MRNTGICLITIMSAMLTLAGCSKETSDWKSASTADTAEAYQQFVHQYPKSAHVEAANTRLQALMEDRDWQAAAAADTRVAYEQFIAQHADSKWVQEARIRIENFSGTAASPASGDNPPAQPSPAAAPIPKNARAAANKPRPSAAKVAAAAPVSVSSHGNFVQLGAFRSKERAQSQWKQLSARYPAEFKTLKPAYVEGQSKAGPVYKLRVPVSSVAAARDLCGTLKKHAQHCLAGSA